MQIKDLYAKYHIMPQLATHMLRVAGVGKIVAENWKDGCDSKFVTDLCLLHDLGNIVKFDLQNMQEDKFGKIDDLKYWQDIQKQYFNKYGHDAHDATVGTLKDANLNGFVEYIGEEEKLYFAEANEAGLAQASVPAIIMMYADCRVKPEGVVSYRERIDDLNTRYGKKTETWYKWTYWFDDWIQSKVSVDLQKITENSVTPLYDELLGYNI